MPKEILQFVQKPRKASTGKKRTYADIKREAEQQVKLNIDWGEPRPAVQENNPNPRPNAYAFDAPPAYGAVKLTTASLTTSSPKKRRKPHRCVGGCGSNNCRSVLYHCSRCQSTYCNNTGLLTRGNNHELYHAAPGYDKCGPLVVLRKTSMSKITIRTS